MPANAMQKNKNSILMVLLIVALTSILVIPLHSNGEVQEKSEVPERQQVTEEPIYETVDEIIEDIAPRFGQDPKLISKISYCESKHKVVSHDGGRAVNVTGIHNTTFDSWLKTYEKEQGETLDKHSTYDQIKMMSWAFSKGDKYRNQWTTYVAYTNGGTYTFYSRLLKGTFTARCK